MFIIKRMPDGKYVADQNKRAGASYTKSLRLAKVFSTSESAARHVCPDNEIVVPLVRNFNKEQNQ